MLLWTIGMAALGDSFGGLVLALLILFLVVTFGTYVGVLMALQSYFGPGTWDDEAVPAER